jgi:hypothetical protein
VRQLTRSCWSITASRGEGEAGQLYEEELDRGDVTI